MKNCLILSILILLVSFFLSCKAKNAESGAVSVSEPVPSDVITAGESAGSDDKWFMAQTEKAEIASVVATSELVEAQFEGRYLYPPINILDGDFENTWCEAEENGPGIGESVTVEFAEPVSFDEIQIVNGFVSAKFPSLYKDNNRIKKIQLTQVAREHFQQKEYTLNDNKPGWQSINFELPQTAQTLTFKITDVYAGAKYDDTCLDDIRLLWQGKVIPFKNVANLKKVQEENSKMMLKKTAGEFAKDFSALFEGKNSIYLLGENPNKSMVIYAEPSDNGIRINHMQPVTILRSPSKQEFLKRTEGLISDSKRNKYNPDNSEYCVFGDRYGWMEYEYYELGNYRIKKTSRVGYVETTTAFIIKLDGKNIFINGVPYTVLDTNQVTDWRW